MFNFFITLWYWQVFRRNRNCLPTKSFSAPLEVKYEIMSGSFFWEDEGLFEIENHHLANAFRHVICHRMLLLVGTEVYGGPLVSAAYDKRIFKMAKRYFPDWIGFDPPRCSYNPELVQRMRRIEKVAEWQLERLEKEG